MKRPIMMTAIAVLSGLFVFAAFGKLSLETWKPGLPFLAAASATIVIATATYHFIERPFLALKTRALPGPEAR